MQIEYRYGDLLTTDSSYIGHCVNAQGKMRSGVAKVIREKYPKAYEDYMSVYVEKGLKLGTVIASVNNPHTILHIVGQRYYGNDGRLYLDYQALRRAVDILDRNVTGTVSFPLIGCGLAGGDWKLVSEIIEEGSTNFQPIVYVLDDKVPY